MSGQRIVREIAIVRGGKLPASVSLRVKAAISRIKDNEVVEVQIKRWGNRASDRQRAYWFAVIVPAYDDYYQMGDMEETHNELMERFWPEGRHEKVLPGGRIHIIRSSFNDLSTVDVALLFERAWAHFALEAGRSIPSPQEFID